MGKGCRRLSHDFFPYAAQRVSSCSRTDQNILSDKRQWNTTGGSRVELITVISLEDEAVTRESLGRQNV